MFDEKTHGMDGAILLFYVLNQQYKSFNLKNCFYS